MIAAAIMCGQLCIAGRLLDDAGLLVRQSVEFVDELAGNFPWSNHFYVACQSSFHIVVSSL